MRIAFATSENIARGREDDAETLTQLGARWEVWNDPTVDWASFDRVIIRSVWDYTLALEAFLAWCEHVGPERLRNRPELVVFNADKRYLQSLDVPTVPTRVVSPGAAAPILSGEVVVKPNVSAGGRDTGRFGPEDHEDARRLIAAIQASGRCALIQPYLPGVDAEGETAVVFIAGRLSHVLHKGAVLRQPGVAPLAVGPAAPAAVMLEDDLVSAGRATAAQRALAHAVMAEVTARFGTPLYARVDMVPGPEGAPVLIELEAIEPCLYLRTDAGASRRFAVAIAAESTGR
ncbi:MAG TPA: hypothetical protein VFN48_08030 [Solirubrobacteraceae bacterium]|nr:hypothetical protein [Solirubrobacteraceae bacterium]